tara:strand:+ start:557 stop:829 length:273 start_codon:yes stop_codon:yes gene_type:complete
MQIGKMEDFTIDQFAGSLALILGSIGGLLMIIWKSRCACRINCCWLFRCERLPPPNENNNNESDDEENVEQQNNNTNNQRQQPITSNDEP